MRIGIDAHVIGKNIGGVERYVEKLVELVPSLCPQHDFIVFVSRQAAGRFTSDARRNVTFVRLPASDPIVQRSVVLPWMVRRHRLDVLQVQRITPWACGGCRIMLTVHDLIPLKYPNAYPGLRNRLIRLLTADSIARADFIVCPTQSVCDDIARRYPATPAPLHPYFNGVDAARFRPRDADADAAFLRRHGIEGPYLFSPGAIEVRKNIETIIAALARLEAASRPLVLLSGRIRDARCFARLQELAAEFGVADRVRHLGFVSDEELVELYGHARACVAASHDEGFNLLPLESLACGTPVLCSDIPVHRELFGDAVRFFPPDDPASLAAAIRESLAGVGDRRAIQAAAVTCVTRLSWEAMAQRMATFFDEMAQSAASSARFRRGTRG